MQGLTTAAYRQIHHKLFPGIDRYYSPFLSANRTLAFKRRELEDVLPENNAQISLVPQILGHKPDEVLWALGTLYDLGYRHVNFNLGCSMPQVARRGSGKGAGMLRDLAALDRFMDAVFCGMGEMKDLVFTVKTRIGTEDASHAGELMALYNRYPIGEVIIHPRLMKDLYGNVPDLETFALMKEMSVHPVCYNGDIRSADDLAKLRARFPGLEAVMIGRGLLRDPALVREIRGGAGLSKEELRALHETIFATYLQTFTDQRQAVEKMKGFWAYQGMLFPETQKPLKKIRKAGSVRTYEEAVDMLLASVPLPESAAQ